jgi:GxxExxY protein
MSEFYYKELSFQIIGICYKVHKALGPGLPELVYNRALYLEFSKQGIPIETERQYKVFYDQVDVGFYRCDLIVDSKIILELKSEDRLTRNHDVQLFTYLNVTGIKVGYLINLGNRKMEFKRLIL